MSLSNVECVSKVIRFVVIVVIAETIFIFLYLCTYCLLWKWAFKAMSHEKGNIYSEYHQTTVNIM